MVTSTTTNRDLCEHCLAELTSADHEAQACTQCGQRLTNEQEAKGMSEAIMITKARYAKNSIAVRCRSQGMFKTREMRLCDGLRGRWSNREKAYILAASKEPRLRQLIADGWDARMTFTEAGHKWKLEPPGNNSQARGGRERREA